MKILAVDSTTEACSVALIDTKNNDQQIIELYELAPREHSQRLLPMVDQVLVDSGFALAQLDAIAFGKGPGSFTGLRICLGMVQGLAFGADLPVVPISSLQCLAQTALDTACAKASQTVVASIDARMDEMYWGAYRAENGLMVPVVDEQLCGPEAFDLAESVGEFVGVGSGWQYAARVSQQGLLAMDDQLLPRASAMATLAVDQFTRGNYCSADLAQPSYIRDQVAWKKIHEQ